MHPLPRVIDLFAGAGGFSLGAEMAGCDVEFALEIDSWAADTLRRNHSDLRVECADIRERDDAWWVREVKKYPDLLIGGPPCQGFSRAGPASKDPKDPRNSLFREFVRVAAALEPRAVVIENVTGILRARTAAGNKVADVIEDELRALGYAVQQYVLDAERYGVPQIRRRVFFVGTLEGNPPASIPATHLGVDEELSILGSELARPLTVRDAIADIPHVDVGHRDELIRYDGIPSNDFQLLMREGAPGMLTNHLPMRHSRRIVERMSAIAPGQSQAHVIDTHAPRLRVRNESAGVAAYDQNNRRMHWDRPCHTLAASFYANFVHPELHRNFTPREGARIQTFPDRYVFEGKPTVVSRKLLAREGRQGELHLCQYNQIGNAVPPLLGRHLLSSILSHDEGAGSVSKERMSVPV